MSSTLSTQPDPTDEDLLIQRLNSQADADEQEAQQILEDTTAEEKALQAEIDQAQIEYDKSLAEMVAAENHVALTEDQARNEIFREAGDATTIYGNYLANQRNAAAQIEANYAMDIEAYTIRQQIIEQEAKLKKAQEYFALGLIPPSATDEQRILFVDAIDNAEKEKWEGMKFRKSRIDLAKIHQALVRAHNAFQLKNKDVILKARYGKKVSDQWTVREEGKRWLTFGSPTNSLPRYGKIMRTYYNVGDYPEKPYDRVYYNYNAASGEWEEENPLLGFRSPPSATTNTPEFPWHSDGPQKVFFTRDGVFPNLPWLRTRWEPYQSTTNWAPGFGTMKDSRDNEFVAYFKDENQKIGRYNQKRAYSKCKPGYWFYETIPEEASQCVYMGHSMVDTNFSYYPASIGFSYEQNKAEDDFEYYQEKYKEDAKTEYDKAVKIQDIIQDKNPTTVQEGIEAIQSSGSEDITSILTQPMSQEDIKQNEVLQEAVNSQTVTNYLGNNALSNLGITF
jgi:hypothetical protein